MSRETSPNRDNSSNPVSENVFQAALKCKDALKSCFDIELLMYEEWAENRLADFNLWAAGSGVFASKKASLEHRLSGQPSLLSLVATSLTLLNDYIEECKVVASDECPTGWTDSTALSSYDQVQDGQQNTIDPTNIPRPFTPWSDQSSSSEIDELSSGANARYPALSSAKENVEQILDNLLRLIVAIRKASSGSRFRRADELYRPSDYLARRRYLELIIQTRLSPRGEKSPEVGCHNITTAQVRLIEANLRRRNRFLYFQTHSEKLSLDRTISGQASNKRPGAKPDATKLPTLAPSSRDPVAPTDPAVTPDPTPLLTDTNASELITKSGVSPTAVPTPSHIAPSQVTSVVAGKVVYPQPPPLPTGHQSFKCPCCCQSLPTIFRDKKIWKKHLMDDIEPYTCYIEECPEPDKLYRHQAQWMEHLRDDHPQCWYCLPCSTPLTKPLLFPTIQELICHTKDAHAEAISDDQLPILVSSSRRPKPFGISRCPLCYTTGEADSDYLLTHIAEHIHQFSLQSLPWPDDPSSEDYFRRNSYFGDIFDSSSASNGSPQSDRDSDDLPSLLSLEYNKTNDPSSDESGAMGGQSHDLTQLSLKRLVPDHIKDSNQLDRYLESFPYPAYDEVDSSEEHSSVDYSADTTQIRSKDEAPRTTDSGANISLEKQLRDAIIYPKGQDGGFIPIDRFDEILTRQSVWRELRSCLPKPSMEDLDDWVDKIWEKSECFDHDTGRKTVSTRRKIFAVLILVKVPARIQSFINEELWDKDLPFIPNFERKWECYEHGHQNEARIVECLNNLNDWSTFEADCFYNYQWFMLSPIFNMADENVIFYSLHGRIILPFEKGDEPDEEYSLVGGYSEVSRVSIHPAHYISTDSTKIEPELFAIKRIEAKDKERFDFCVESLKRFRNGNHPHLIQLLATYRHGEYYYLIFPCAEGNLIDFWVRNSEPQKTYQLALWIASQCRGIAEGLRAIHNDEFENASLTPSELNRGRHGDIKPENILWFKSSTNMEQRGDDVLKISDFGLTRWHREVSSNQTDGVGVFVSRTYRAPEYDLKISPSQSWDIWNLACLYLDLLTWYLLGWEKGVDEFSRQRAAESSSSIREDNYFNMEPATGSEFGASLKQCVMTWINRLHATEGCSLFIHDFLDIIQDGMLLIHHDKRLGSKEIHHRLANLYDICRENKVYCFESVHESHQSLGVLLRTNLIKHCWGRHEDFLTLGSLRNLLQPTEIGRHLQQFYKSAVSAGYQPQGPNIGIYLKLICPNDRSMDNSVTVRNKTYIRLFAILVLIDKGVDVFKFIDNGLSDEALPIDTTNNTFQSSIGEWRQLHLDSFDTWQWRMNVPFLSYGKHRVFGSQVVLPFVEGSISTANNPDSGRLGPIVETGGYGEVSCVEIHADCHDFRGVFGQLPKPEGPFALKKIIGTSPVTIEDNFKREARMLKKFNGDVHPHIISVLSTFKHGDYYYLLFPWAECDLQKYFKVNPNPTPSLETVRWLSQQCLRIVEAVHLIHSPPGQDNLQPEDRVVGRHGDIKAENVLVFRSQEGKANLVLSDFGLGSLHHDMSKSNIPNKTIPVTPGLRPPECDMKGGYISSAFDIWTLGCLFLDLLTWLLGGEELRLRFEEERMTPYINGLETPIYFDIVRTEDGQPAYIVKEQVKRWFAELHRNDHCTQFVHDFLDLIERKMLIVETDVKKRARTNELLQRLQTFHSLCHGQDAQAYCVRAAPDQTRLIVPTTIAKGPLNETVEDNIRRSRITLRKVAGRAQRAEQAED